MQDIISICLVVSLKESFFTSFQAIRCLLITTHCISAYNLKIESDCLCLVSTQMFKNMWFTQCDL